MKELSGLIEQLINLTKKRSIKWSYLEKMLSDETKAVNSRFSSYLCENGYQNSDVNNRSKDIIETDKSFYMIHGNGYIFLFKYKEKILKSDYWILAVQTNPEVIVRNLNNGNDYQEKLELLKYEVEKNIEDLDSFIESIFDLSNKL